MPGDDKNESELNVPEIMRQMQERATRRATSIFDSREQQDVRNIIFRAPTKKCVYKFRGDFIHESPNVRHFHKDLISRIERVCLLNIWEYQFS